MVKIRLRRTGAKKQPHYRVVVADSQSPRDGKFIETIGHYNPRTEPPTMEIDAERAVYWLSVGAQPSAAVERMLDKLGILAQAAAVKSGQPLPAAPEVKRAEEPAKVEAEVLESLVEYIEEAELLDAVVEDIEEDLDELEDEIEMLDEFEEDLEDAGDDEEDLEDFDEDAEEDDED